MDEGTRKRKRNPNKVVLALDLDVELVEALGKMASGAGLARHGVMVALVRFGQAAIGDDYSALTPHLPRRYHRTKK